MAKKGRNDRKDSALGEALKTSLLALAALVAVVAVVLSLPYIQSLLAGFPIPIDTRPPGCDSWPRLAWKDGLVASNGSRTGFEESVSILVPYYKEEWRRIQVTMRSILRFTDMRLVKEIMWVSDGNPVEQVFANELKALHRKVTVLERPHNIGLIKTKMLAAKEAQGAVLLFLEPHVVVNNGWLEPLLAELASKPKGLLMPALDSLYEDMTLEAKSAVGHWRFEWNMNLVFTNPFAAAPTNPHLPVASPGTAAGIFIIRKDWWEELDLFDAGFVRFGGDGAEASHKVWRCGGLVEIVPCSRVAHWFRNATHRPYEVKTHAVVRNYKRIAEAWFDNYKEAFYRLKPEALNMDTGDLSKVLKTRNGLKCNDMEWYLNNVDLELFWEHPRICIPGSNASMACPTNETLPGRSTIDQRIPVEEYQRLLRSKQRRR